MGTGTDLLLAVMGERLDALEALNLESLAERVASLESAEARAEDFRAWVKANNDAGATVENYEGFKQMIEAACGIGSIPMEVLASHVKARLAQAEDDHATLRTMGQLLLRNRGASNVAIMDAVRAAQDDVGRVALLSPEALAHVEEALRLGWLADAKRRHVDPAAQPGTVMVSVRVGDLAELLDAAKKRQAGR